MKASEDSRRWTGAEVALLEVAEAVSEAGLGQVLDGGERAGEGGGTVGGERRGPAHVGEGGP